MADTLTEANGRDQDLQRAAQLLAEGKRLIDDDPEGAVTRLQDAVQLREKHGVALVPEAGAYYLAYAHALLAAERCSSDVFGSKVDEVPGARKQFETAMETGRAEVTKEKGSSSGAARSGASSGSSGGSAENQDPNTQPGAGQKGKAQALKPGDKGGKAAATAEAAAAKGATAEQTKEEEEEQEGAEEEQDGKEEDDDGEDAEAENEEGPEEADGKSLAWEMFEMARSLFLEAGASDHLLELGDLHSALSDLHAENAAFGPAEEELLTALNYVTQLKDRNMRSEAEIHFKLTMILHYKDDIQGAVDHSVQALEKFQEARRKLEASLEGLDEKIKAGDKEAAAALAKGEAQLADFDDCLVTIQDRKEDMEMVLKENARIKAEIAAMFRSMVAVAPPGSKEAKVAAEAAAVAEAGGSGLRGVPGARLLVDMQAGAVPGLGAGSLSGAGPSRNAAPAQDLGKVGRGRGRITLQPVAATTSTQGPSLQQAAPLSSGAANGAAPKRSLEGLLGAGAAAPSQAAGKGSTAAAEVAVAAGDVDTAAGAGGGEAEELAAKRQKTAQQQEA